jgi:hypothetical protein
MAIPASLPPSSETVKSVPLKSSESAGLTTDALFSFTVETAVPEPLESVPQLKVPVDALYRTVSLSAPVQPEVKPDW